MATVELATEYADAGWSVFPLAPGSKIPRPGSAGFKDATSDPLQIWNLINDGDNVGIATGEVSGLFVLDVDCKKDAKGFESLDKLQQDHGALPATASVQTPSGGQHYYFKMPQDADLRNTAGKLGDGLDTRANGGYVVAAGSTADGGAYEWRPGCSPDEIGIADLPGWLVELTQKQLEAKRPQAERGPECRGTAAIANGSRNATLTSKAGSMRRMGLGQSAIRAALSAINQEQCQPPVDQSEIDTIAASVGRYEPDAEASAPPKEIQRYTLGDLVKQYPRLNPPVVEGLFRESETVNLISASKIGKSWLVYNLALSIVSGSRWLDTYDTAPGKVLLIDNELHKSTLANRIPKVAEAMGIDLADHSDQLEIWPLRGDLRSLTEVGIHLMQSEPGTYRAVILDAKYRFATLGASENDNAAETLFYNQLDQYAETTKAAFVLVHHSSKGSQSDKRVTDVGSGAGAQSRATDCHMVLREHSEEQVIVLDAAVRSFAPVKPLCLKWEFPLWSATEDIDPTKLKAASGSGEGKQQAKDREGKKQILELLATEDLTKRKLRTELGMGPDRCNRLVYELTRDNQIERSYTTMAGREIEVFNLPNFTDGGWSEPTDHRPDH